MKPCRMTWEERRERGRWHFVLMRGALGWGVPVAALVTLSKVFTGDDITTATVIIDFTLFPLGGMFCGLAQWRYIEARYQARLRDS
ncbi:MAG TPA: hypothetical protein VFQ95_04730 [Rhodanobacteraceae bacterium]|nr:hypothetical protein [Rhodanobacteraceae bacterium]